MSDLKALSKYLLFFINCLTFLCGVVLFFLGFVLHSKYNGLFLEASQSFEMLRGDGAILTVAMWCLVMGVILAVVSGLGLVGSIREDFCSLLAFSICLGIVILLEWALGVAAFALAAKDGISALIIKNMNQTINEYGTQPTVTKVWDILQTDFECCGVGFPGDWSMTPWGKSQSGENTAALPMSCCPVLRILTSGRAAQCHSNHENHFRTGCAAALGESTKRNSGVLGTVACLIGMGQVLLLFASIHLLKSLKKPATCYPCY